MALACAKLAIQKVDQGLIAHFRITPSGNYAAGGEVFTPTPYQLVAGFVTGDPDLIIICGVSGFIYSYDNRSDKMQVWCNTAGGVNTALGEHTAIAYVAGVTGDFITATAFWFGINI